MIRTAPKLAIILVLMLSLMLGSAAQAGGSDYVGFSYVDRDSGFAIHLGSSDPYYYAGGNNYASGYYYQPAPRYYRQHRHNRHCQHGGYYGYRGHSNGYYYNNHRGHGHNRGYRSRGGYNHHNRREHRNYR